MYTITEELRNKSYMKLNFVHDWQGRFLGALVASVIWRLKTNGQTLTVEESVVYALNFTGSNRTQ